MEVILNGKELIENVDYKVGKACVTLINPNIMYLDPKEITIKCKVEYKPNRKKRRMNKIHY